MAFVETQERKMGEEEKPYLVIPHVIRNLGLSGEFPIFPLDKI